MKPDFVNGVNLARATKHYSIAAKVGCEKSMGMITTGYTKGMFSKYITKKEYEVILRAHKDATDSMKSDQRDEAAKWMPQLMMVRYNPRMGALIDHNGEFVGHYDTKIDELAARLRDGKSKEEKKSVWYIDSSSPKQTGNKSYIYFDSHLWGNNLYMIINGGLSPRSCHV